MIGKVWWRAKIFLPPPSCLRQTGLCSIWYKTPLAATVVADLPGLAAERQNGILHAGNAECRRSWAAITQPALNPESIKVLDPACGSGHILDWIILLKNIYEERGYRGVIFHNWFWKIIFWSWYRRPSGTAFRFCIINDGTSGWPQNIYPRCASEYCLFWQESLHLDIIKPGSSSISSRRKPVVWGYVCWKYHVSPKPKAQEYQLLMRTLKRFVNAKTLGSSWFQVPQEEERNWKYFWTRCIPWNRKATSNRKRQQAFIPFIQQAWILAQRYDAVVANPPYMAVREWMVSWKSLPK